MALETTGTAPYAPARTIIALIDQYRDKGLPTPITKTTLQRAGVEESLSARTLQALRILDLIDDDGQPTETLTAIGLAKTEDLPSVLAGWVQAAYREVFAFINATDDVQRITDQFRHYQPAGMRNRMVTLFLGLCAKAELIPELPKMPRTTKLAPKFTPKPKAASTPKADPPPPKEHSRHASDDSALTDARQRYIDILLARAADSPDLDVDLLDRIERAIGIAGATP